MLDVGDQGNIHSRRSITRRACRSGCAHKEDDGQDTHVYRKDYDRCCVVSLHCLVEPFDYAGAPIAPLGTGEVYALC